MSGSWHVEAAGINPWIRKAPMPTARQRISRDKRTLPRSICGKPFMLSWERIRPQIHGLGPYLALKLVAEYGDHLSAQGRASKFFRGNRFRLVEHSLSR
jgi:hypothetical protein